MAAKGHIGAMRPSSWLLAASIAACAPSPVPPPSPPKPLAEFAAAAAAAAAREPALAPVRVQLYVMSQCPYGVEAENGFALSLDKLGGAVDFRVDYIGDNGPDGLISMHGPREVAGDLVQLCAQKYSPKWFQLVLCQNRDARNVDSNWRACAEELGAPADAIARCAGGDEGKKLLAASFRRAQQVGARGSPTIYIGDQAYRGGRRPAEFMHRICDSFGAEKPAACGQIPEPPKVNVTLVSDKRCSDCDASGLERQLRHIIANPNLESVDYGDPKGKALLAGLPAARLPLALFDATLDADEEAAATLARHLRPAGERRLIRLGDWNPRCADDGGCALDDCKPTLECRPEEPGKLEVFIMSQCPFALKGVNALQEVLANFGKHKSKVDFTVHYIGDVDANGDLRSMHGPGEVAEDIRELCALEHYGKGGKYLDYVWCRNKDITGDDWEACAGKSTGIDAKVISKCVEGEGRQLLEKSFALATATGISASPTWLVNGKYKLSGIDAETIKAGFCEHNKLPGCEVVLTGPPAKPGAPESCGGDSGSNDGQCGKP